MLLPRFERKEGKSSIDVHVAATTLFASDATCKCGCPTPANVTLHPEKVELEALQKDAAEAPLGVWKQPPDLDDTVFVSIDGLK